MTLQEKELLTRFLQQLASAHAGQKDTEAQALIKEAVARQPDAAYLLVQRAIQLEQLLAASQAEVQKLQAQANQSGSASGGRFLGDPNAWGRSAGVTPAQGSAGAQGAAPAGPTRMAPASSWGSGLFGNIASTAAGVVAGSFLFQGIQGLMNRGESQPLASDARSTDHASEQAQADQPELLNTYFTEADSDDTFLAGTDDSSDFV